MYPVTEGRIVSSEGLNVDKDEFEEYFEEYQLPRSTALYSKTKDGRTYEVGAVARLNNNLRELPQDLREKLSAHLPIKNPFKSILARMTEVVLSLREVKLILERTPLRDPSVDFKPREGEAVGLTEAPRSILYHRYRTDSGGRVRFAKIVPPYFPEPEGYGGRRSRGSSKSEGRGCSTYLREARQEL